LAAYRQQQPAQHQPQQSEAAPSIADFNYDMDQWAAAMADHTARKAQSIAQQRFSEQEAQRHQQTISEGFNARAQKYSAEHPDFDEALYGLSQAVQFRPEIVEAVGLSENGPAVAHYLAKHLDEADRISRMPVHLAAAQLGRIEERLSTPQPKPVSNAPAPAPRLGGGSAIQKDPDRMSADEWLVWRRNSLKK
jgi:hypothetical protein